MAIQKNHGDLQTWAWRINAFVKNPLRWGVMSVIFVIMLGEFVLDLFTPVGGARWVGYFVPLLLSLYINRRIFPLLLGAVISGLIMAGFYLSPNGAESHLDFISRCGGIGVVWLVAILIDTHIRVDVALRASEERYRLVVEDQTAVIARFAADGTLVYVNEVLCRLFGRTSKELLGTKWHPRAVKEDLAMIEERLRALSPANPVVTIENRIYNGAGEVRWFQFINRGIFDAAGSLMETQSVGQDITERKQAEVKFNDTYKLLTAMCDSSTDAIYIKDVQGRYLVFNQQSAKFVGKTPSEVVGKDDRFIFPAQEAKGVMEGDRKVMESGQVLTYEETMTTAGGIITYLSTKGPIYDSAGKLYGLFGISRDITERKRVEEDFKLMEQRYRNLAESSPDAIFIIDRTSTIQYVNRVGAGWLGKPAAKVLGRSRDDFFPPDLALEQHAALERVFTSGEMLQTERSQKFPGGVKWVETRLVPLRDDQGKVVSVMGISRDLTERRQAEVQLATLAHAVESTAEMICITDMEDRFTFANSSFLAAYGYTEEELLGKTPDILVSPKNPPALLNQILLQSRAGGWQGEVFDRRKDGTEFWIHLSTSQIKLADGRVIGLMGVSRDITAQKVAEAKIRELASIVQSSEDAIISVTPDETIVSWNLGAEHLLGFTSGEAIGKNISIILPPEHAEKSVGIIRKVALGEPGETFESVRRHKDGTLRDVSIRVSPVVSPNGKVVRIAAILRDIRARKQLEKTVLEISTDERRRIGHELHDGLGQQLAGIAFKSKVLQENLAEHLPRFAADAKTIVGLINGAIQQTRNLARGFDPVDFEVDGLPAALQTLSVQTEALYGIECAFHCNEARLDLDAPTSLALYRITQEAINNAIKHGQARRIKVDLQVNKPQLSLIIRDKGKGFDVNAAPRQGMGLRIMGYRTDTLGGMLYIHSEAGVGTEIKCVLPKVFANQKVKPDKL